MVVPKAMGVVRVAFQNLSQGSGWGGVWGIFYLGFSVSKRLPHTSLFGLLPPYSKLLSNSLSSDYCFICVAMALLWTL
jgi:hypothetical protein